MDWKLEVVVLPVSDVDRAKEFYADRVGFHVDLDRSFGDAFRVVQLTPPASACSVTFGTGLTGMPPGSLRGLQLVVDDVQAARAHLLERGVGVSPVRHFEDGIAVDGPGGDRNSFIFFDDPDSNSRTVQQKPG